MSNSIVTNLIETGLFKTSSWVKSNLILETVMGSHAYGTSTAESDTDLYAIVVPPKYITFPHTQNKILGFHHIEKFECSSNNKVVDTENQKEYDVTVYGLVRYVRLAADGNPNIIDSLFTPNGCLLHVTQTGLILRDNRRMFLSKNCFSRFRSYATAQFKKLINGKSFNSTRYHLVEKYGFDPKFAYHCLRLMIECHQILTEYDIDITKAAPILTSIRNGELNLLNIHEEMDKWQRMVDKAFESSTIPDVVDESAIGDLLLKLLESHYGTLSGAGVERESDLKRALRRIDDILTPIKEKIYGNVS